MTMRAADIQPGVAQLVDNLAVGGAENLAIRIANGRAEMGRRSFIYVLRDGGPLADRVHEGVVIRYLDIRRRSIANPFAFLGSLLGGRRKLLARLTADQVTVVQSHLTNANFWALLLAVSAGVKCTPTIHNNQEFQYGNTGLRGRLNRLAYRLMLSKCLAVIACSQEVRSSLIEALGLQCDPGRRLVTVTNGVKVPEEIDAQAQGKVRARYGVGSSVPLVVAAGRLTDQKNQALLVEAMPAVRKACPLVKLIIAGEGELGGALMDQVRELGLEETVIFPGNIADLGDLMQASDVFVLPSKFEGLPLVLLEAMACGLVPVCTDIKGTAEVIDSGVNGFLFPLGSPGELADTVVRVLGDAVLRENLGSAARRTVRERYDFRILLDRLDSIYTGVS